MLSHEIFEFPVYWTMVLTETSGWMQQAGLLLRKWSSNTTELMLLINASEADQLEGQTMKSLTIFVSPNDVTPKKPPENEIILGVLKGSVSVSVCLFVCV